MKEHHNNDFSTEREIEKNILKIIDNIEKANGENLSLRKSQIIEDKGKITNTIKFLVQLFSENKMSVREKVDTILEYSDEYELDKLFKELGISFLEFNTVISGNVDNETLVEIDRKLTQILSSITETISDKDLNNIMEEKEVCLRNSKLDAEADEFAEKLYRNFYGKNE